jgi:hypothetical protein
MVDIEVIYSAFTDDVSEGKKLEQVAPSVAGILENRFVLPCVGCVFGLEAGQIFPGIGAVVSGSQRAWPRKKPVRPSDLANLDPLMTAPTIPTFMCSVMSRPPAFW